MLLLSLIIFLLAYLINNANSWCKYNDNSVIITIFANKIKCIYENILINQDKAKEMEFLHCEVKDENSSCNRFI